MAQRLRQLSPLTLTVMLLAVSVASRVALLDQPCRQPCRSASDHVLVFDESYYVNAARVIAGVSPPVGARYAGSPLGDDPNAEHPQLAKLIMAGSIELFGDGPFAWRIGSIVFGTLALLGLFTLVMAVRGSRRMAVGACALMVCDNLLLVHGRIGTLDIYVLAAMLWGAALYLLGRPVLAGMVIGIGACIKLVGPYVLLVLGLFELLRWLAGESSGGSGAVYGPGMRFAGGSGGWRSRGRGDSRPSGRGDSRPSGRGESRPSGRGESRPSGGWRPFAGCTAVAVVVFFVLLTLMDQIAPPYDAYSGKPVTGGPFGHLLHMITYGASQTSPDGPTGISSYPWQWIVDYKPIVYLNINPAKPAPGLYHIHPAAHFLGMMSPVITLVAIPALLLCAGDVWRRVDRLSLVCLAWFLGTFIPFVVLSLIWHRTSYIYYMVIVMPAIYIAVVRLVSMAPSKLRAVWIVALVLAVILMFPFIPLP
jgi:hypothetical protein